jgi:hypothetical protein
MSGSVSAYSMPARLNGEFSERNGSPREAGTLDAIEREIDDEVRMRFPGRHGAPGSDCCNTAMTRKSSRGTCGSG